MPMGDGDSGHLRGETPSQHIGTSQIHNWSPISVFREQRSLRLALKLYEPKTQSQIRRKTVEVYKLLFLIIESTGGGSLASFVGPLQLQTDLKPLQHMAVGR